MQPDPAAPAVREAPASLPVAFVNAGTRDSSNRRRSIAKSLGEFLMARQTVMKYAVTGATGYFVYIAILIIAYDLALVPFLPARGTDADLILFTHGDSLLLITTLVATQASIIAVFAGHCRWTFADRSIGARPLWLRFAQFEARALVSTLAILTIIVNIASLSGLNHFLAVPIGLAATFGWNWLWDSKFIWKGTTEA